MKYIIYIVSTIIFSLDFVAFAGNDRNSVPCPDPIYPVGSNLIPQYPVMDWSDVPGASTYNMQISLFQDFSFLLINAVVKESHYPVLILLPSFTPLFWKVRALDENGNGNFCWSAFFRIWE